MVLREGDYMYEIVLYIETNSALGYKEDEMRKILVKKGYSRSAIEKGFRIAEQNKPKSEEKKAPAKVVLVDSSKEEPKEEQKSGFFSKLFSIFKTATKEPTVEKVEQEYQPDETVKVDEKGNLIQNN